MGAQIWAIWPKIGPKIKFFAIFSSSLLHQFSFKLRRMIALNILQVKPLIGSKLAQGFCHFLKVPSLVFPNIAQDYSLGQCLTASRAETSKKSFLAKIRAEMIFSILMLSSVHSNLFVLISAAVSNIKKVSLELGGKSPLIIFGDCDMDKAVRQVRVLFCFVCFFFLKIQSPASEYIFKVNRRNTLKVTIKTTPLALFWCLYC